GESTDPRVMSQKLTECTGHGVQRRQGDGVSSTVRTWPTQGQARGGTADPAHVHMFMGTRCLDPDA
ncbi:MAG: hypothetical protein ACPIOQ_31190, partial [Promethearchaeia archaeon]